VDEDEDSEQFMILIARRFSQLAMHGAWFWDGLEYGTCGNEHFAVFVFGTLKQHFG
jgi:hypothetical protein